MLRRVGIRVRSGGRRRGRGRRTPVARRGVERVRWHFAAAAERMWNPLVNLRYVAVEHRIHLIADRFDVDLRVGAERRRLREEVGEARDHRIVRQRLRVGHHVRHSHHVARVAHQQADRAMIRVIVVNAMGQHEIGRKRADLTDHLMADRQRRLEFAVGILPHLDFATDHRSGGRGFVATAGGERRRDPSTDVLRCRRSPRSSARDCRARGVTRAIRRRETRRRPDAHRTPAHAKPSFTSQGRYTFLLHFTA